MKKFLLVFGVLAISLPAFAGLGVEESTSSEYLRNYGCSNEAVKYIQLNKAQVNGEKFVTPLSDLSYRKYYTDSETWNNIVDKTRSFFIYLDPSLDGDKFMRQDIKYYANTQDL